MICKNCGTENSDDSAFCLKCGSKLNYIPVCKACGRELSQEAVYCPYCGEKQEEEIAKVASGQDFYLDVKNTKKILRLISGGLAILLALLSLAFVGFTGIECSASVLGLEINSQAADTKCDFLYFFDGVYRHAPEFDIAEGREYLNFYVNSYYALAALGTVIAALTILSVAVFGVVSLIRSISSLAYGKKTSGEKTAIAAFFAYISGAVALRTLNGFSVDFLSQSSNAGSLSGAVTGYNAVTLAGIILGAIFLALTAGLKIAVNYKNIFKAENIKKFVFSATGLVLIAVTVGILGNPLLSTTVTANDKIFVDGYASSTLTIASALIINAAQVYENVDNIIVIAVLNYVFIVAMLAFAAACFVVGYSSFTEGNFKLRGTFLSGLTFVCAIVIAVTNIVNGTNLSTIVGFINEAGGSIKISSSYAGSICLIAFVAINFVFNIVQAFTYKKN